MQVLPAEKKSTHLWSSCFFLKIYFSYIICLFLSATANKLPHCAENKPYLVTLMWSGWYFILLCVALFILFKHEDIPCNMSILALVRFFKLLDKVTDEPAPKYCRVWYSISSPDYINIDALPIFLLNYKHIYTVQFIAVSSFPTFLDLKSNTVWYLHLIISICMAFLMQTCSVAHLVHHYTSN